MRAGPRGCACSLMICVPSTASALISSFDWLNTIRRNDGQIALYRCTMTRGAPSTASNVRSISSRARLHEHLDGHVVGNALFDDQLADEIEIRLRCRRIADLDFLEADRDQHLEEFELLRRRSSARSAPDCRRADRCSSRPAPGRSCGVGHLRPVRRTVGKGRYFSDGIVHHGRRPRSSCRMRKRCGVERLADCPACTMPPPEASAQQRTGANEQRHGDGENGRGQSPCSVHLILAFRSRG